MRNYQQARAADKTRNALRRYYQYLSARLKFYDLGFVDICDREYNRINKTRSIYFLYFAENNGFRAWIWAKHITENKGFYKLVENLKNEILRSEDNGLSKN